MSTALALCRMALLQATLTHQVKPARLLQLTARPHTRPPTPFPQPLRCNQNITTAGTESFFSPGTVWPFPRPWASHDAESFTCQNVFLGEKTLHLSIETRPGIRVPAFRRPKLRVQRTAVESHREERETFGDEHLFQPAFSIFLSCAFATTNC